MIDEQKEISLSQMHELTHAVRDRLNYFSEIKEWLEGYGKVMKIAAEDGAPVDNVIREQVQKFQVRCTELILADAKEVLEHNIYGDKDWDIE